MAIKNKKAKKLVHRSGFEDDVIEDLVNKKVTHGYETLELQYVIPESKHKYTPDVILANGIICELKGYMDAETRKKMKLVVEQNPKLDIRMVFQNPNVKLSKASKTTYAVWATKLGIKYGVKADIIAWSKEKP